MTLNKLIVITCFGLAPALLAGQSVAPSAQTGLDPAAIAKPLGESWPTYSGDYSGRRYSSLAQINQSNVRNVTLAWVGRLAGGPGAAGGARGGGAGATPTIVGGVGSGEYQGVGIKGAILEVDGILYLSAPDNAWAIDARDGREIWHYFWKTRGGTHIGSRGVGLWHNY